MTIPDTTLSNSHEPPAHLRRIAFIGNYLPALCGIATFTTDLVEALATKYSQTIFLALPSNDGTVQHGYPERVRFVLDKENIESYHQAASFLNMNNVDLVCLQHEFGIFGGPSGRHILSLLHELQMPVVTTLHTVLKSPTPEQTKTVKELAELSDRIVAMTQRGQEFLKDIYHVAKQKIDLIPHGIPNVPFMDPNFHKDQFGVEGKTVLLTFGLISPNKGLEYVIEALPAIIAKYPNVVYLVVGATHPNVIRHEGEAYRDSLIQLTEKLGVTDHVIFQNRFVSSDKLTEYISAADIYITPYLNVEQVVSGTLSYAVGAGKPVISTPYWHAEELLAENRGMLVPFRDAGAIGEQVLYLLENETKRHAIRKRAYIDSRKSVWTEVAGQYMASFSHAKEVRFEHPQPLLRSKKPSKLLAELPTLKLDHLHRLTDSTGILQHAFFSVPRYQEGHTTDDNARALITAIQLEEQEEYQHQAYELTHRYLAFLYHAFNQKTGRFRNFLTYERQWREEVGSEDSHGRAIWALGTVLGRSRFKELRGVADRLIDWSLPTALKFKSPRAVAFTLLGIHEYLKTFSGDQRVSHARRVLANRLAKSYTRTRTDDWRWFEDILTYSNAKLPHALLLCGQSLSDDSMTQIGLESLEWLATIQRSDEGHFVPIGTNGHYPRGKARARFDQQPVEAHAMVSACVEAYHLTGDDQWHTEAQRAFEWFLGRNDLNLSIYNPRTGGCHDGLEPNGVNQNEGAESTLAFLMSLLEISALESLRPPAEAAAAGNGAALTEPTS